MIQSFWNVLRDGYKCYVELAPASSVVFVELTRFFSTQFSPVRLYLKEAPER